MATTLKFVLLLCALLLDTGLSRPSLDDGDDGYQLDDYANDDDPAANVSDYEEEKEYTGPPPVFAVGPLKLEAKPGDNITFPCTWKIPGGNLTDGPDITIMWKNGSLSLAIGGVITTPDKRVHLQSTDLSVTNVQPMDRGVYTCEIMSDDNLELQHTLEVFEGPTIAKISPNKSLIEVVAGEPLHLSCEGNGYPKPTISWTKKRKAKAEKLEGSTLKFEKVVPGNSGDYECIAKNAYGESNPAHVKVAVHYRPKITVINEHVTSGVEYDSELECKVESEPKAKVKWMKNNQQLHPSSDFKMTHNNHIHKLTIHKTKVTDFGIYTCEAENNLGSAKGTMHLSRTPSKPTLKEVNHADGGKSVVLEWTLESYAPISQYQLRYRNKMDGEWKTESPEVTNAEGNIYTVKHKLSPQPPGEYEAILVSVNQFGTSESAPHTFQLTHELGVAEPRGEPEPPMTSDIGTNSGSESRPRLMALLTVLSLSTFFLL